MTTEKEEEARRKMELFEARLRAIEGADLFGSFEASELNLVPGLVLPPKFKMPGFERYDGSKCPKAHLIMYCRKMTAYFDNEKLMIHCFQDSLTGSASRWYNRLERSRVSSWDDLAQAFMTQYKHVAETAPDRHSLQNMEKKPSESFREYACRWHDAASQVQPPLTKREITTIFLFSLKNPYFEMMLGHATTDFAGMMISGERIENAIKSGRIEGGDEAGSEEGCGYESQELVGSTSLFTDPRINHINSANQVETQMMYLNCQSCIVEFDDASKGNPGPAGAGALLRAADGRVVCRSAPDRRSLQNMEKKPSESFKEYACRWHDAASQVQPPLTKREITTIFLFSLKHPYFEMMVGHATTDFADVVMSGERIENAIKSGRIEGGDEAGSEEGCGYESQELVGSTSLFTDPRINHINSANQVETQMMSLNCQSCIVEFDGASKGNPGPAGAGALLRAADGRVVCQLLEGVGIATNNVAEYRAAILGMKYALKVGFKHIHVQGDSNLVCMQVQGRWKIKSQKLVELNKEARKLKDKFMSFKINHVDRQFNSEADALANHAVNLMNGQVQENWMM